MHWLVVLQYLRCVKQGVCRRRRPFSSNTIEVVNRIPYRKYHTKQNALQARLGGTFRYVISRIILSGERQFQGAISFLTTSREVFTHMYYHFSLLNSIY